MNILRKIYEGLCMNVFGILRSEKGQTLVEYGLLLALIAVLLIIMVKGTGQQVNCVWSKINSGINQ
jgi:Flp pilus assembly pilin Flp